MKIRFLIFLILSVFYALALSKSDVTKAGNETSRYAVVESVLERGTFVIAHDEEAFVLGEDGSPEQGTVVVEDSIFFTPDKGAIDGRYYGDKPPLLTFVSILWGRLLKCFGVRFQANDYRLAVYLTNALIFVLSCFTCWFFYVGLSRRKRMPEGYRVAMSLLSVASTLVLSYAVTMNNHTICAAAMMGLILLMERCEETGLTRLRACMLGVTTGLLLNLEFVTGGVMGLSVFVFVLTAVAPHRFENALMYAIGAGLMILCEAGMNMVSYGSPLPLYLATHKPSFTEKNYLSYAFNILFGYEGFFLYMPALLFAGCACFSERMRRDRVFVTMMASTAAAIVLFAVGTSDFGGWCYGFRFLIPFAPVLLYYAVLYFGRPRPRLKRWSLFRAALLWGVVFSVVGAMNPWTSGYEGSRTPKDSLPERFKNSFLSNAFVFCWRHAPDSAITQMFMDRVYGDDVFGRRFALLYLEMELRNRNDWEGFERAEKEYGEWEDAFFAGMGLDPRTRQGELSDPGLPQGGEPSGPVLPESDEPSGPGLPQGETPAAPEPSVE